MRRPGSFSPAAEGSRVSFAIETRISSMTDVIRTDNLNELSLNELIDLLVTKTSELIDRTDRKPDGAKYQILLGELKRIQHTIRLKREKPPGADT